MRILYLCSLFVFFVSVNSFGQTNNDTIKAVQSLIPVVIDGAANDACWEAADWKPINQVWIPFGTTMVAGDFEGKFKVAWNSEYLYLLIEVVDNMLSDDHVNPLVNWWDDDCLEIFVDENRSMGNHERNTNAFAYHINLKYDAIDLNATGGAVNYKNNIIVKMDTIGTNTYLWEVAIKNYTEAFSLSNPEASRVMLTANKLMGLSVAYCDNDETNGREHFIGSMVMPKEHNNDSYINADYFGPVLLRAATTGVNSAIKNDNQLVSVYPNPAEKMIKIERKDSSSEDLKVELRSATGTLLRSVILSGSQQLMDIGNLLPGMYVISIISDQSTQSEMIIKR